VVINIYCDYIWRYFTDSFSPGAHQVRRTREHVTPYTININGKIQIHSNNSIFLIRINFLKMSQFSSSLQVKMDNNQNLEENTSEECRLLAISEHIPGLKISGSLDGIRSQNFLTAC